MLNWNNLLSAPQGVSILFQSKIKSKQELSNTQGETQMILIAAFILAAAAAWIVNKLVQTGYQIYRLIEDKRFERWLECHPEV